MYCIGTAKGLLKKDTEENTNQRHSWTPLENPSLLSSGCRVVFLRALNG